jgi:5-methylcytosine-specific restriction endonuclease McrA
MPDSITCAVAVCDRPATKREWCEGHYTRWRKTGDPGTTALRPQREHHFKRGTCSVSGCSLAEHCKGLCASHYVKSRKTGDPGNSPLGVMARAIDHEDDTRTCNTCLARKPLEDFYAARNCSKGRRATCIECCRHTGTERRALVPYVYAATSARRRARKSAVEVDADLTHDALRDRDGDACHYCQVVMDFNAGKLGDWNPRKASIDHVIPLSRGGSHTFSNTVLACLSCNIGKRDKPVDEWRSMAAG